FDNDGTLWCEKPMYFQVLFAFDRIKATAAQHPEWKDREPFKSVLDGDLEMLQYTTIGQPSHLGLIVHHADAEREYAYDRTRKSATPTKPGTRPPRTAGLWWT